MNLKTFLTSLAMIIGFVFTISAQIPNVIYSPFGELILCKECGHNKRDTWRGKFRIQNLSEKDLIVYGGYYDGKFRPSGLIQTKNLDVCEWRYGNNKNTYISWSEQSPIKKEELLLKSKQSIEFETHFGFFDFKDIRRFLVYIKDKNSKDEPEQLFSDAFTLEAKLISDNEESESLFETPKFVVANDDCKPKCNLSLAQSPIINKVKLGMSVEEFSKLFPNEKINKPDKNNSISIYIYNKNEDARWISAVFLNGRIIKYGVKFDSVPKLRGTGDFYMKTAQKLGLEKYWTPYNSNFECENFIIEIMPDNSAEIIIWDKTYKETWEKIVEDSYLKK